MTSMQNVHGSQGNLGMNKQQQSIPVKSSGAQSGMRHAKTYAATLSLVFIACALGGRNLDAQGLIRTQPADVTIKPGEAAVVTLALNSFPQLVQIYRIVPPDTPELFGELLSLNSVWTLPVSERRRYIDESTHGDYVTGKLFTIKEGVIFETTSFNFFVCEPSSFGIGDCGVTRTFTVFVEEQEELTRKGALSQCGRTGRRLVVLRLVRILQHRILSLDFSRRAQLDVRRGGQQAGRRLRLRSRFGPVALHRSRDLPESLQFLPQFLGILLRGHFRT